MSEHAEDKGKKAPKGCLFTIIGIVLFVAITSALAPKNNDSNDPQRGWIVSNSPWDGSVSQVKNYLDKNLKDPKSFEAIEWSSVVKNTDGSFSVRCKYRAKNSFGGYVVANQLFRLTGDGNIVGVVDF